MSRCRHGSRSWACSALLVALAALSFVARPAVAATDDQNLTGLVYLADGTPLSATPWADNTSFAAWVNHTGDWASAWRYPATGWYLTSGGAYSIVLPAAEKNVSWADGDPYRLEFDVSAISGTPGRIENATSHGTGDPGEFSPYGRVDNVLVWNAADNWQRWDVVLLTVPDLAVLPGDVTATPLVAQVGQALSVSATVRNLGDRHADGTVALFLDADSDRVPDAGEIFDQPPFSLDSGATANFVRSWTPTAAGTFALCAYADPGNVVAESDEGNNVECASVVVLAPPETRPDYVPVLPQPPTPVRAGLSASLTFSVQVRNDGNATASATATLAFFNETTPGFPFATFPVPMLAPSETSVRFAAPWNSPAAPGTVRVTADVDSGNDLVEWNETNNRFTWTIDVVAGPVTNLVVGTPNVTAAQTYVTPATALSFTVLDQGGAGIRNTTYRVDGGAWINYTATGPFSLPSEGPHLIEWSSEDFAGNVEAVANATIVVDDTPPSMTSDVGEPKYAGAQLFVTSSTPFTLSASDGGADPVGLASLEYRLGTGPWTAYALPFTVGGPDGPVTVDVRASDLLGNAATQTVDVVIDDTPPVTTASHADGSYPVGTSFAFTATDAGSGVAFTQYRVDGGPWIPYGSAFVLPVGGHVIAFTSTDRLNNTEAERTLSLSITIARRPPTYEGNWKPLVAAVFAAALGAVGVWSARRRPWKGGTNRKAMLVAFAASVLPFVLAEAATGVVSLLTGLLSIPPAIGIGTAIDVAILSGGLLVAVLRARDRTSPVDPSSP